MGLVTEYLKYQQEYQNKYGEKTIVLYQNGTFYEIFEFNPDLLDPDADRPPWPTQKLGHAVFLSTIIEYKLTKRNNNKPYSLENPNMIGFPCIAFEKHAKSILAHDYTIVVVDQERTGKNAPRSVTRILSPATEISDISNVPITNEIVSIYIEVQRDAPKFEDYLVTAGISTIDVTTGYNTVGEIYSKQQDAIHALQEIYRFLLSIRPREIIIHINRIKRDVSDRYEKYIMTMLEIDKCSIYHIICNNINKEYLKTNYHSQFLGKLFTPDNQNNSDNNIITINDIILEELGLERFYYGTVSYIVLLQYCYEHNERLIEKLRKPDTNWLDNDIHLVITDNAINQLDLLPPKGSKKSEINSLLRVLDNTNTPLGKRYLSSMLTNPITDPDKLNQYYDMTNDLVCDDGLRNSIIGSLKCIPDMERYQRKLELKIIKPHEFVTLFKAYIEIVKIYTKILNSKTNLSNILFPQVTEFNECLRDVLTRYDLDQLVLAKLEGDEMECSGRVFYKGVNSIADNYINTLEKYDNQINNIVKHLNTFLSKTRGKLIEYSTEKKGSKKADNSRGLSLFTTLHKGNIIKKADIDRSLCGNISVVTVNKESMITSDIISSLCEKILSTRVKYAQYLYREYNKTVNIISNKYNFFGDVNMFVSKLDYICSNSISAIKYKYFIPTISSNDIVDRSYVNLKDMRHPIIERIIDNEYIPNDINLGYSPYGVLLYGANSLGKCLSPDTPVMLFSGKNIQAKDVKVGYLLMGDDKTPRTVVNTVSGHDEMFRIKPTKGDSFVCTGDHILVLKSSAYQTISWSGNKDPRYRVKYYHEGKRRSKSFSVKKYGTKENAYNHGKEFLESTNNISKGKIIEITVKDYIKKTQTWKREKYLYYASVEFPEKEVDIDPYILGYWLGDGTSSKPEITTADMEVLEYFKKVLGDHHLFTHHPKYNYYIKGKNGGRNPFLGALRKYNLLNNKHIPDDYKYNSSKVRKALLAGLIDSDGSNNTDTGYDIIQKNKTLFDDIVYLSKSLGYSAYPSECTKTCTNAPNGPVTGTYHRTYIGGDDFSDLPLLLDRKFILKNIKSKKEKHGIRFFTVESIGKGEYYGFETDGNHRFLLGDFTVTHNSSCTKAIGLNVIMAQAGMFVPSKMTYYPYNKIITRLSGNDNLIKGQSSYIVEVAELRTVLRNSDDRTLVLGDEICRGTEIESGSAFTINTIRELVNRKTSFIFSTHMHHLAHDPEILSLPDGSLRICHLKLICDRDTGELIFDRKLEEGSGEPIYGLEIAMSLGIDSDFMKKTLKTRKRLMGTNGEFLSTKTSRYNKNIYMDHCVKCGKRSGNNKNELHSHHIKEQNTADKYGYIGHYHKDSKFNFVVLCDECHSEIHKAMKNNNINDQKVITTHQTTKGKIVKIATQ
jgi:DNA mismatch repair ATPase MutS